MDSWDGEWAYMKCTDGATSADSTPVVGSTMLEWRQRYIGQWPSASYHSGTAWTDVVLTGLVQGRHTSSTLRVYVGSTLDEAQNNESFGIGSVEIWIR